MTTDRKGRSRRLAITQESFPRLCRAAGLPAPVQEYLFHPVRKWRFDLAWPAHRVALEIEGGVWTRGSHVRGPRFLSDMEKYNEAGLAGWLVLRCTPDTLVSSIPMLRRALAERAAAQHPMLW